MKTTMDNRKAYYFGLEVEVLCAMENCSSIRFRSKEFHRGYSGTGVGSES